jgi:outer membrane immunogenic protein
MKRKLTLAATVSATALAIGAQARAADLPAPTLTATAPPIYSWTGVYVGVNGGWADGISTWTNNCPGCQSLNTPPSPPPSPPGLPGGTSGGFSVSGYIAGGTLGANYQIGPWVYGVEGDFDWTHLTGNSGPTCGSLFIAQPNEGCETESDWLATLRGRVGYAFPGLVGDNVLIYGTAGGAFARIKTGLIPPSTFDTSTVAGWSVGAGVEVAFAQNWTAKVEYLFVDLPNVTCTTTTNCGFLAGSTVTLNENMVRVGVNYKFQPW